MCSHRYLHGQSCTHMDPLRHHRCSMLLKEFLTSQEVPYVVGVQVLYLSRFQNESIHVIGFESTQRQVLAKKMFHDFVLPVTFITHTSSRVFISQLDRSDSVRLNMVESPHFTMFLFLACSRMNDLVIAVQICIWPILEKGNRDMIQLQRTVHSFDYLTSSILMLGVSVSSVIPIARANNLFIVESKPQGSNHVWES